MNHNQLVKKLFPDWSHKGKKIACKDSPAGLGLKSKDYPVGTLAEGADGFLWEVSERKDGRLFWKNTQVPAGKGFKQDDQFLRSVASQIKPPYHGYTED